MSRLIFVTKKCRSPWCPNCGIGYWGKVRAKIKPHMHTFKRARILTLTIDRKKFSSGQEAYEHIEKENGYIRRFLRLFGFKKAFKVMAFHNDKAKNGTYNADNHNWPHWHIIVDVADVNFVDLKRAWRLWRDKWGLGGLDIQLNKKFRSAESAINYAISYCQHQVASVADWVVDAMRAPRCYEFYGELRKAISEINKRENEITVVNENSDTTENEEREKKTEEQKQQEEINKLCSRDTVYVGDRIHSCSCGSTVLFESERLNGSKKYQYFSDIDVTPGQIAFAFRLGYVTDIQIEHVEDYENISELRVSLDTDNPDRDWNLLVSQLLESPLLEPEEIPI